MRRFEVVERLQALRDELATSSEQMRVLATGDQLAEVIDLVLQLHGHAMSAADPRNLE